MRIIKLVVILATLGVSIYSLSNEEFAANYIELIVLLTGVLSALMGIESFKGGQRIEGYFYTCASFSLLSILVIGLLV
ncbi:hypothetical protein CEH05_07530 [Halobacillus halophilus]|uniref:hypothetical protein n=1 Tax=Halobacillus halophilus TaxID=1570 RepID=UPI0002E905D8|nr:hypothetical protein [Halobacillus halophilus]ASF38969.1 hypothetical protein CEH05_07530 [Halobacillus halophilus]